MSLTNGAVAPVTVLFCGKPEQRADYEREITAAARLSALPMRLIMDPDGVDRGTVDYLVFAANGPVTEFAGFTRLRAILNLWAGVEAVLKLPLPDVPLARMVEEGLTLGMVDYVVGHVARHHLDIDRYLGTTPILEWERSYPPLARDRRVGILGLGALGIACAEALKALGFQVYGWSRSAKSVRGVTCLSGADGLDIVLSQAEILVLLLPQTAETVGLLDAGRIARMPEGACVINAGRGPLIDDAALIAALDAGHLHHATLDVFDVEPLPPEHPFWAHPRVTVTPHIASATRPETAARALVANIQRDLAGQPLIGLVDRAQGY